MIPSFLVSDLQVLYSVADSRVGEYRKEEKIRVDGKMVSLIWYMLGLNYSVIYLMGYRY